MVRWKAMAADEVAAIEGDIGRARALLTALTQEIAPVARAESDARANLAAAVAAEEAKADAILELG
jgi:outer membrane PBP1 activator LpoA protein